MVHGRRATHTLSLTTPRPNSPDSSLSGQSSLLQICLVSRDPSQSLPLLWEIFQGESDVPGLDLCRKDQRARRCGSAFRYSKCKYVDGPVSSQIRETWTLGRGSSASTPISESIVTSCPAMGTSMDLTLMFGLYPRLVDSER